MPKILPSQIVAYLDQMFPWAMTQQEGLQGPWEIGMERAGPVSAILDMLDQLPPHLLNLEPSAYAEFIAASAELKAAIRAWNQLDKYRKLSRVPGLGPLNPITHIRKHIASCPDESVPPSTSSLNFITDAQLRENLRLDLAAVNAALNSGEWKAATVLAGSILEAFLLWAVLDAEKNAQGSIAKAGAQLVAKNPRRRKLSNNPDDWTLADFIGVSEELNFLKSESVVACQLARDFRNLIHPGRARRLAQTCNRGTALAAVAAVELVLEDLS